jgi:FtsZ-binding cell division protein ZapB
MSVETVNAHEMEDECEESNERLLDWRDRVGSLLGRSVEYGTRWIGLV